MEKAILAHDAILSYREPHRNALNPMCLCYPQRISTDLGFRSKRAFFKAQNLQSRKHLAS